MLPGQSIARSMSHGAWRLLSPARKDRTRSVYNLVCVGHEPRLEEGNMRSGLGWRFRLVQQRSERQDMQCGHKQYLVESWWLAAAVQIDTVPD